MIASREMFGTSPTPRLLRLFVCACGLGLILSAIGSLILRLIGIGPPLWMAGFSVDPLHAAVHICWGLFLLVPLVRGASDLLVARIAIIFGTFYLVFAILGLMIHDPLGMRIGSGETIFHFIVGPLALALGITTLRAIQKQDVALSP
jgi:hypothetical protein